jgi:nucleotide-binding universal stress UspA family protein
LETQKENLLNSFPGVVSEVIIEEGDLWDNLLFAVEKKKIDLIVMGTRGRSGVGKFFMGSVSEEIFRKSPCAVVTVGPFSPAEPARAGVIAEILFATNFSPESLAAAPYALSLAQEYQARLTLLHVIEAPKTGEFVIPQELLESSLRRLRDIVPPEVELWCKPRFLVEEGPAAEKILDVARRKKADLIVLGVHEPSGFPGAVTHLPLATAHKVVSHAPCPVLTARH